MTAMKYDCFNPHTNPTRAFRALRPKPTHTHTHTHTFNPRVLPMPYASRLVLTVLKVK